MHTNWFMHKQCSCSMFNVLCISRFLLFFNERLSSKYILILVMIDISVIWFIKLAHFWKYHENNVVGLSFHLQVDSKSTISIDTIQFSFPLTLTFWYHLSLYPLNHTKDLFSYLLQFSLQIKDERVSKPVCNTCYLTHFFSHILCFV